MSLDPDFIFALHLQKQFEHESNTGRVVESHNKENINLKTPQGNLIDKTWELIDPTPNIYSLFIQFDKRFFWNKLNSVAVKWSKRMTSCAGICSYEGRGGMCTISLSEPLLKLRPRKDLVETLLHEMIHAFLFVTHNNRDRDGHGPEFHKHMYRINQEAGTKITVYHSFHDEVDLYKTHWWRCNGVCRDKKPYFGIVKRVSNRKPGPNDFWWDSHQISCGGIFIKIREPTKKTKQGELATSSSPVADIRNYMASKINSNLIPTSVSNPQIITYKDLDQNTQLQKKKWNTGNLLMNSGSRTLIINSKNSSKTSNSKSEVNDVLQTDNFKVYSGKGYQLISTNNKQLGSEKDSNKTLNNKNDQLLIVRNHWAEKFNTNKNSRDQKNKILSKHSIPNVDQNSNKKRKFEIEEQKNNLKIGVTQDKTNTENSVNRDCINIETSSDEFNLDHTDVICLELVTCPVCSKKVHENKMNRHLDECLQSSDKKSNEKNISCLVCGEMINESMLNEHLNECIGDVFDDEMELEEHLEIKEKNISELKLFDCPCCPKKFNEEEINEHLDFCLNKNLIKK